MKQRAHWVPRLSTKSQKLICTSSPKLHYKTLDEHDLSCNSWTVGSDFGPINMNTWIHPACLGSIMEEAFSRHTFGLLSCNLASFFFFYLPDGNLRQDSTSFNHIDLSQFNKALCGMGLNGRLPSLMSSRQIFRNQCDTRRTSMDQYLFASVARRLRRLWMQKGAYRTKWLLSVHSCSVCGVVVIIQLLL